MKNLYKKAYILAYDILWIVFGNVEATLHNRTYYRYKHEIKVSKDLDMFEKFDEIECKAKNTHKLY